MNLPIYWDFPVPVYAINIFPKQVYPKHCPKSRVVSDTWYKISKRPVHTIKYLAATPHETDDTYILHPKEDFDRSTPLVSPCEQHLSNMCM